MIKQLEKNSTQPNTSSWSSDSNSMTLFLNMQKISQDWAYLFLYASGNFLFFSSHMDII